MATQKPTSNISYNTEAFLREKLDTWVKGHDIQGYMYIYHIGEEDGDGHKDKDHIHLYVIPNKKLDMMDYSERLVEYVLGEDKPRRVKAWRPSKIEDWLLYVVHWPPYMKIKYPNDKGEKIEYSWEDIKCSDTMDIENEWRRALIYMQHSVQSLVFDLERGVNPIDLVKKGENPFTVSNLVKLMSDSDYSRLLRDYQLLVAQFQSLRKELHSIGTDFYFDENNVCHLSKAQITQQSVFDTTIGFDENGQMQIMRGASETDLKSL